MTVKKVLPQRFRIASNDLRFEAFSTTDWSNYQKVYADKKLMLHIAPENDELSLNQNFKQIVAEHHRSNPKYRSYQIFHQGNYLGILGLKWHTAGAATVDNQTLQIGVVILESYQHCGWSKKIKTQVFEYVLNHLFVRQIIAYCHQDNNAANHVNQSLGMLREQTFLHPKKQVNMNKWFIDLEQTYAGKK